LETAFGRKAVSIVALTENVGFARGCNIGSRGVDSEFILFLNPDAALLQGSISAVVDFMCGADHASVGICGVQLIDEAGLVWRSSARFPTARRLALIGLGIDRLLPQLGTTMKEWDHQQTQRVDQVIGAFFFVRTELFASLGGFDERFFVYYEEVDFAFRASKQGAASVFLASVQAFHAGGGTSEQARAHRLFYSLRSRVLYAFKHFSRIQAWFVFFVAVALEPFSRVGWALGRGSLSSASETFKGYIMLWRWLSEWLARGRTH
jgi:GT2 family glycosyltransferase